MKLIDGRERKKSLYHSKGVLLHGEHMTKREMQHAGKSIAGPPTVWELGLHLIIFFLKLQALTLNYTKYHLPAVLVWNI